ncbi:MAG: ATP-dependent zinc metalloprotease FtsH [Myxococcota bacterium]|nr:ATP-dependent zinc metalloprotease FtsH [Myxococcota bacterium]
MKQNNNRGLLLGILLAIIILFAFFVAGDGIGILRHKPKQFSEVLSDIRDNKIESLKIQGQRIEGTMSESGERFYSVGPVQSDHFVELLEKKEVPHSYKMESEGGFFQTVVPILCLCLTGFLIFLVIRQLQGASGKAMSFGKSRARMLNENEKQLTFADVAGLEEAKEELSEIVEFLKDSSKFTRLGGRIPKGVLMVGPPGTGKTLLAKAVAGEAGVPFFSISGSDFVEMFVGVGASRVRDLFEQGKKNAPCIIFIDEIDAVGRHRGAGMGGGHDEREQTLNQLLVEMDGFESNEGVILVAATNRPDVLDPALLRPGRFDRRVHVGRPDLKGRLAILKVHTTKIVMSEGVDLERVAKGTPGFSGADLANLVNEAALIAARHNKEEVELDDFEDAKDKVSMGAERRSMLIPEKERKRTAYHEAGHAIVATVLPESDQVHKVTIIPRGQALGVTQMFPDEDRLGATSLQLETRIAVCMGGRAAEELIFNEITTGAHNDLQQATRIARAMVTEYGMSSILGPVNFGGENEVFLGRDYSKVQNHSDETSRLIDNEIHNLLNEAYKRATTILNENKETLHLIAKSLLEKETLDKTEFDSLVGNLRLNLGNT